MICVKVYFMKHLNNEIYQKVLTLCKAGDDQAAKGKLEEAKDSYLDALELLPSNHKEWEAATWIYVAVGDVHLRLGNYEKAFKAFYNAVQCPTGLGNPYIHFRLGQLYFEQENWEKATDEFVRAYMGAGLGIFMEDDPKYLEFLETKIKI